MSLADVTSANCVGYANITLRAGNYMTGSSFDMIGKAGMRLTDLKPTGYEITYWQTGKGSGKFNDMVVIQLLDYQGKITKTWKWLASYDKTSTSWVTGYWYDVDDPDKNPIVAGTEADYQFSPGDGIWVKVDANAYSKPKVGDDQYKLVNAGQAMMDSQTVTLRPGNKGVVAPLSRAVRLTEIKPTGYEITYWQTGKGSGKFNDMVVIQLLDYQGKITKTWKWLASYDKTSTSWVTGYWYDVDDPDKNPIVAGTEADYQFKLGDGLWVKVDANAYSKPKVEDDQYSLEFPGVDDDNRVTK